ncbi:MAG: hypothetical protein A3F42_03445 [Gammaproteobacteria bacterium RIFCSPHIGHO2_12_FULL_37_34]|nr:MAG: hypothetical protein A3F42_03445 [Gammaproteobacteria bacterium RIFCSPHIGHO2_12_FULL_37_34]
MSSPMLKHKIEMKRLEARISTEKKKFLQHAADLVGRSLTDFVVHSAYEAATRVIKEYEQIRLSLKDRDVFIKVLLNPPLPSKALLNITKKYKRNVLSK